ncbi:MAG: chromosomal replication initiator protein DnaA [Bacteroidales bacterium]|nr:chromosomal replication initiator protein DnaA [Bacteroidales bacterium]
MIDNSHIELWDKCRQIIRDNIPEEQYNVWFKDVTSYQFDNGILTLIVPSSFFVEQLEERYLKILEPAIRRVYGDGVKLYYRFFQAKGQPDTAVKVLSTNPSSTILDQAKAQPANPFKAVAECDIDPQLNPRYTFDNYCEGESNKIAVAIGKSIVANPKNVTFNPLFLFGNTGVGKTHLIQAIGIGIKERSPMARVLYVTARLFESQYTAAVANKNTNSFFHFYQSIDTLIIDDIQDLHGKPGTQNTFFYIFNHLHQNNKQIIMSSDCAPAEMDGFEARLLSRFKWGMAAQLETPDLELRRKVLVRKAEQNGLELPEDVIEYVATHVTDSIRDLEGIVVSMVAHATVMGCDITIDLARQVIERAVKVSKRPINFEVIADEVCTFYKIDPDMLFTKTRKREVSDARQVVMYLAKKMAKMTIVGIGHKLDRTHATVNYACKQIEDRLPIDKQLQQEITTIQQAIING